MSRQYQSANMTRAHALIAVLIFQLVMPTGLRAQTRAAERRTGARAAVVAQTRNARDAEIARMLAEIDARNIERTIRKLVSFGTRNTLSAQDDPKRGIGAARAWLYQKFQDIAKTSDGRMTVELQTFEQPPGNRIPTATKLTNVVATLRGTESPDRIYVVSGHYDSMCTSPTDTQ